MLGAEIQCLVSLLYSAFVIHLNKLPTFAIATLTGLSRQTIISSINALVKTGLLERLPAKSSRKTGHFRVIGVEMDSKGRPVRKSDLSNNTTGQVLVKDRSNNRTGSRQEIRPQINIVDETFDFITFSNRSYRKQL